MRRHRSGHAVRRHVATGQFADAALARQPRQHGHAQLGETLELREQLQVVRGVLAEAEARIDDDALLRNAGHFGGEDALGQETVHLAHHIVVLRCGLHRTRFALHVHQHDGDAECGGGIERAFAAQAVDIVDHPGARLHGRAHHLGLGGVDADRHGHLRSQAFDHRHHATKLFFDLHFGGAGSGGFAADVEHVGALLHQPQRMRDGGIGRVMRATVGERVRGDVDDAHHLRAVEPEDAAGAVELGDGVEHHFVSSGLLSPPERPRRDPMPKATPNATPMAIPTPTLPIAMPRATPIAI